MRSLRLFLFVAILVTNSIPSYCNNHIISLDNPSNCTAIFNTTFKDGKFRTKGMGGIEYDGSWNLSSYSKIEFNVTNSDNENFLLLSCILADSTGRKLNNCSIIQHGDSYTGGITEMLVRIKPGESRKVVFLLPPDVIHPEVDRRFGESLHIKNCAYSNTLGLTCYRADLKEIRTIRIVSGYSKNDTEWTISDIKIYPGEKVVPNVMKLSRGEYFPMIDRYGQFKHKNWPGKIHSDKDLWRALEAEDKDLAQHPAFEGRSRFGGWLDGPRYKGTGNFRVEKIDGKWWMIDPDGYLYWAHGVVRVTPSCAVTPLDNRHDFFEWLPKDTSDQLFKFYYTNDELLKAYYVARGEKETYDFSRANICRKYGDDYYNKYAIRCHERLKSWGMNLIANSSDKAICLMDKTPYNDRVDLGAPVEGFPKWPEFKGSNLWCWWQFIDPFDPLFETCVRAHLMEKEEQLKDPWCIGMFVDNEIQWGDLPHLGRLVAKADSDFVAKKIFLSYLHSKYNTIDSLNKAWNTSFSDWQSFMANKDEVPADANADCGEMSKMLAEKYFQTVRNVYKSIAPDKLYLGCRFAGAPEFAFMIGTKYCDVISWNIYAYELDDFSLMNGVDKPVMMGEFHFGALDRGNSSGGLKFVNNQEDKGAAYEHYVMSALKNPFVIGTNWHQFSDQAASGRFDGESFQVGIIDCCDTPYQEMVRHIRNVSKDMYSIRFGKK